MTSATEIQGSNGEPIEAEIILYQSDGANVPVQVTYFDESLWLTQKAIAELFGVSVKTVSEHLSNIFTSGELEKASSTNSSGFSGRIRGAGRPPVFYSLDAIEYITAGGGSWSPAPLLALRRR